MHSWSTWIAILAFAAGCSGGHGISGAPEVGEGTLNHEQLGFVDSETFDSKLSEILRKRPQTVVVLQTSFTVNEIPERLDRWFYVVQESGGRVVTREHSIGTLRSSGSGVPLGVEAEYELEPRTYDPASAYDAVILFDIEGLIRSVTFEKRS